MPKKLPKDPKSPKLANKRVGRRGRSDLSTGSRIASSATKIPATVDTDHLSKVRRKTTASNVGSSNKAQHSASVGSTMSLVNKRKKVQARKAKK